MDTEHLPQSVFPHTDTQVKKPKQTKLREIALLWLVGMFCLIVTFVVVSRYFDTGARLTSLISQGQAIPLQTWTLRAFQCPSHYADLNTCTALPLENESGKSVRALKVVVPLSPSLKSKITRMNPRPTHLYFTHTLTTETKQWLSKRISSAANSEASSQALKVQLGSFECITRAPSGSNAELLATPESLICSTQTSASEVRQLPERGRFSQLIVLGSTNDFGPSRWPFLLVDRQILHEVMSLDNLARASFMLWNLISLLIPVFVIALRFVYKSNTLLNTLADYSTALFLYTLCVIGLQNAQLFPAATVSLLSIACVLLEGIVLTLLLRYAYTVSSGNAWPIQGSILIATFAAIIFLALYAVSKQSPQDFILRSHYIRDFAGAALCLVLMGYTFYTRRKRYDAMSLGHPSNHDTQRGSEFGTMRYYIRFFCTAVPLFLFCLSNLREVTYQTMKTLRWEDLMFLPSQIAVITFFLGIKSSSKVKYDRKIREQLETLFSGILSLQRTLTPLESIDATVKGIREALPAAMNASVEYIESKNWDTDKIQNHITLFNKTLCIPLHGTTDYKGFLRFEGVERQSLTEEEDYIISTMASALAENIEKQESVANLEKMHQASLRFVPHDFLRLLKSTNLTEFSLGDHVELNMAVMFTDIRNFTKICEGMTPSQNFEFINDFLTQIAPVVKYHGGFIDKYIGDAIMALFPESPSQAIRCAIDIQITMRSFNDRWLGLINQEVAIGTGIHYGPMVLGIVGHAERLSSTVMSDSVNLASHLESLTKKYQAKIIVSEDTLLNIPASERQDLNVSILDSVQVKGRSAKVTLYEVNVPEENLVGIERAS